MEIAELGEFAFIDRLTKPFELKIKSSVKGVGDDAAVIDTGDNYMLMSSDLLLEGVNFNLIYTPLKHLGFKSVVVGLSDIIAMNGRPSQIMINIGLSARFTVEQTEELYSGIKAACDLYNVDLVGGDTSASMTGLTISVTAIGSVDKSKIVYRSGAKPTDLICITGDLGAAYLGVRLLEREKRVLDGNTSSQPVFTGYEYPLERALKPSLRKDIIESLDNIGVTPTSMIDLSDGVASDLKQICKSSSVGARLFLDRIPISSKSFELGEELSVDPIVAALNGGEDYELLFTVPISKYDDIIKMGGIDIIGHITDSDSGVYLTTPDGSEIAITAQGWK